VVAQLRPPHSRVVSASSASASGGDPRRRAPGGRVEGRLNYVVRVHVRDFARCCPDTAMGILEPDKSAEHARGQKTSVLSPIAIEARPIERTTSASQLREADRRSGGSRGDPCIPAQPGQRRQTRCSRSGATRARFFTLTPQRARRRAGGAVTGWRECKQRPPRSLVVRLRDDGRADGLCRDCRWGGGTSSTR